MKVAFNSLPLKTGHKIRGIGYYTKNLLKELRRHSDLEIEEFADISEIKNADVVHYPFFDLFHHTLPIKKKFPTVVTVHDVTPLVFPQFYPPGFKGSWNNLWQRMALRNVKAVITDSRSSEDDIVKYLGVKRRKIDTIYLAAGDGFRPLKDRIKLQALRRKYRLPARFGLYVGSVNWNKNLLNLTEGCLKAGLEILFVGGDFKGKSDLNHPEKRSFKEFLRRFGNRPEVHMSGFVPEKELVGIFNLAQCLLLPSFYEGFGLPILEAQACGLPVITGKISSMPEIAGRGALLVDPYSVDEIAKAVTEVSGNVILRDKLIKMGFDNAEKFSWEKTAEETVKVYAKVSKKQWQIRR